MRFPPNVRFDRLNQSLNVLLEQAKAQDIFRLEFASDAQE